MGRRVRQFHSYLDDLGLFVNEGKIIDACFVEVPRQRVTWWRLAAGGGIGKARTRAAAAKIRKIADELRPRLW